MIRKITELSKKHADISKHDPDQIERHAAAVRGQAPKFLIVSPIHRASQNQQLLQFGQGDAFHATRIPGAPLSPPNSSPYLFGGPAAYNKLFPKETGIILTFDLDEAPDVISTSLDNVVKHPDLVGIPIIALRVDYDAGRARLIPHRYGRTYEIENYILKRINRPDVLDESTLVIICSDSRIAPPETPLGVPMAIQLLGAYLPPYDQSLVELVQLDEFLRGWLAADIQKRGIIVVAHGNFEGDGPSCGAAEASLSSEESSDNYLKSVVSRISSDVLGLEGKPVSTPEERAISIGTMTVNNLRTYPSILDVFRRNLVDDKFIGFLKMDTVTNVVSPYEIDPL
ncbi:MAG: hypothetical protein ACFFEF_01290 [Candidatus Thorarchaeota archaeon]